MNSIIESEDICEYGNIQVKDIKELMNHKLVIEFLRELKNGKCTKYTKGFLNNSERRLKINFDDCKKYFGRSIAPTLFRDEEMYVEEKGNMFTCNDFTFNNETPTKPFQKSSNVSSRMASGRKLTTIFAAPGTTPVTSTNTTFFSNTKLSTCLPANILYRHQNTYGNDVGKNKSTSTRGFRTLPNSKSVLGGLESLNFKHAPVLDVLDDSELCNVVFESFNPENIDEPFKEVLYNLRKTLKKP